MKTSFKIIAILALLATVTFFIWFKVLKDSKKNQPHDYHKDKITLSEFSTLVIENQESLYIKSGDSNTIELRYWGKKKTIDDQFSLHNDTLYLRCKLEEPETSLHLTGKNIKKIIVKNKSYVMINKFGSEKLDVYAEKSRIELCNQLTDEDDSTKYQLKVKFELRNKSNLSVSNADVVQFEANANNSTINLWNSKFGIVDIDLKSGSDMWEKGTVCNEAFKLKSDNKSMYSIQYNRNEKN